MRRSHEPRSTVRTLQKRPRGPVVADRHGPFRRSFTDLSRPQRNPWHEHPFIIAAAMAPDPYYISYWSALSFHNLTTQMPPLVSKGWRKQDLYTSIRAKEADWDSALRVLVAEPPSFDEALDVVERALRPIVGKVRE